MKRFTKLLLTLALTAFPTAVSAQLNSVILEAEAGTVGSQFAIGVDGATTYAAIQSTIAGGNPTTADRVIRFTVTFPHAGVWELYARLRVGAATFNDDSMFYANGFGEKNPTLDADWILANGLAGNIGFTNPTDKVTGGGFAGSGVWKWVKLSAFDGGEPPISFTVPDGALTQTFQIAGREDGLWLDKFAFGPQGVFFTVFDLDNGLPGTTEPPPPPYTPTGPPIATGKPKFLGSVSSPSQNLNFTAYFNQVTPENAGKWGSVEPTRDNMNWTQLDFAYNLAKNNGFPFRLHTLVWGNQQPGWIAALPIAEQRGEIEEWFAALAARYPDIDFIDVVNEPLHDPPDDPQDGGYLQALGGSGVTGWDWIVEAFRLARQYFPTAKLGLNEFSVTNNTTDMIRYIGIVNLLKAENLIDVVGVQGHAFSTRPNIPMSVHTANLDRLAETGLPIHVTELDIDGPSDEIQLADYQRIFPVFWEHPAVRGITLWGYRPGHWRTAQGAYIVLENGAERPAMVWLKEYVAATELAAWVRLGGLNQVYDGTPRAVTVTTIPEGLPVAVTYNGSTTPPTAPGSYHVVASVTGEDAFGSAEGTLVISASAVSRHAPTISGALAGSVQMLLPDNVSLGGGATVSGDLLVPGSPEVILHGSPAYGGTVDGSGDAAPSGYTVTIGGDAALRHVVRATDPVDLPTVPAPTPPTGTRDVVLRSPGESPGSFATLRNLSLKENVGLVTVPPGNYGSFSAASGSGFVLGFPAAGVPAVYNLQGLTLKEGSRLEIRGPVILNVGSSVSVQGASGNSARPEWLTLRIAAGDLAVDGVTLDGYAIAPAGTVIVNSGGTLRGGIAADRIVIRSGGAVITP